MTCRASKQNSKQARCPIRGDSGYTLTKAATPTTLAILANLFLQKFHPQECWAMTYCYFCSKPLLDEQGGGYAFVTATAIEVEDVGNIVYGLRRTFELNGGHP